jgi:uncharacterized repeat protein (TIGR02543 family)
VKKTYTVTYNANGGINPPASQTKTHGVTLALTSSIPTREGYDFKGWATSSTASSVGYSAGGSYTGNANITLYAVWEKTVYTITYNANGGSGAPSSQTKTYGQTITLSTVVPTRTNHVFMGWATSSSATTANYASGDSYSANGNATLYAVWIERNYDFSVSNLTITPSDIDQYEDVTVSFRLDSWDRNLPYDNIPVEVLLNGSVIYTTKVNFVKYGVQNIVFDLNVGALVDTQTLVARVNWADHSNETRTGNNSVSSTFIVNQVFETSAEQVTANGDYIEGYEVITSYYVSNESGTDILPDDEMSFTFTVYKFVND